MRSSILINICKVCLQKCNISLIMGKAFCWSTRRLKVLYQAQEKIEVCKKLANLKMVIVNSLFSFPSIDVGSIFGNLE